MVMNQESEVLGLWSVNSVLSAALPKMAEASLEPADLDVGFTARQSESEDSSGGTEPVPKHC